MSKRYIGGFLCLLLLLGAGCSNTASQTNDTVYQGQENTDSVVGEAPSQEIAIAAETSEGADVMNDPEGRHTVANAAILSDDQGEGQKHAVIGISPVVEQEVQDYAIGSAGTETTEEPVERRISTSETLDDEEEIAPAPAVTDVCTNIEETQTTVPASMTASGNICTILQASSPVVTMPEITELESDPSIGRVGEMVTVSYSADNAAICALSTSQNIQVPFVGRLSSGEVEVTLDEAELTNGVFTYYLICADNDWRTDLRTLTVAHDLSFMSPQPTSFFSANGGNIGNGGNGVRSGVPFVEIIPLREGAMAILEMDGKLYTLDANGIDFYFYDLTADPTWVSVGTCTQHDYVIGFSYSDDNNSNITGTSPTGAFCLNDVVAP